MTRKTSKKPLKHPRGEELDRLMDDDRAWFERHSNRNYRVRFAAAIERFDMKWLGEPVAPETIVLTIVRGIEPGVRMRLFLLFSEVWADPADIGEDQARTMFNDAGGIQ